MSTSPPLSALPSSSVATPRTVSFDVTVRGAGGSRFVCVDGSEHRVRHLGSAVYVHAQAGCAVYAERELLEARLAPCTKALIRRYVTTHVFLCPPSLSHHRGALIRAPLAFSNKV